MDAFDGILLSLPVPPIREADLHPLARVTCRFARWLLVEAIPEEQREVSAIKKHVPGPAAEGFHRWQFHSALEYLSESDVSYWSGLSAPGSPAGQVWEMAGRLRSLCSSAGTKTAALTLLSDAIGRADNHLASPAGPATISAPILLENVTADLYRIALQDEDVVHRPLGDFTIALGLSLARYRLLHRPHIPAPPEPVSFPNLAACRNALARLERYILRCWTGRAGKVNRISRAAPGREGESRQPTPRGSPGHDCPVLLKDKYDCPIVRGEPKPVLTPGQYAAISALVSAFPDGLTGRELNEKSGYPDARTFLRDLSKVDLGWKAVLRFPQKRSKKGTRDYGIKPVAALASVR